ncbi:hypothetical protein D3C71_230790 [compost metagenome]
MRTLGFILIGVGVALIGNAFFMSVAVDGGDGFGAIANNDLLNQRLMYAVVGAGSVVSGFLSLILKAISR